MNSIFFDSFPMSALPRQTVPAGAFILEEGLATDRLLFVEDGTAIGRDKIKYAKGHVINFKEFLAGSLYLTSVKATSQCRVICIPREAIRDALCSENTLTWTLARSIAADHLALAGAE